jgi:Flp pilus assembly protein TadD
MGYYLRLMFVPYPLSFYYGYNQIPLTGIGNVFVIFSLLAHTAIFAIAMYLLYKRKHPIAAFGLLFYLLTMIPLSNMITPIAGVVGERLAFSASLGFCIAFAYLLFYPMVNRQSRIFKKFGQSAVYVSWTVFFGIIILFSVLTHDRNFDWKNHLKLFEADIGHLDNSARAQSLYGSHLVIGTMHDTKSPQGKRTLEKAVKHFRRAVEIHPGFAHAWNDLGKTYIKLGDFNGAIEAYTMATKTDTMFVPSIFELGVVLDEAERYDEAESAYLKVIRKDSTFMPAYINLSHTYHVQGRSKQSIAINLLALKRNPNHPQTYDVLSNIGKTYLSLEDYDNALIYFEQAIALSRSQNRLLDRKMLEVIAGLYQNKGDFAKAQYYINLR